MNKIAAVGIVAVIVGIVAIVSFSSNNEVQTNIVEPQPVEVQESTTIENPENSGKEYTISLSEQIGVADTP